MPQGDISFHNTANCESIDLLIRQSKSRLGSRRKNLTIPTPGSATFSLLTLSRLPTPPSVSGLSNLFALYQIIKHEKIQAVFPNVEQFKNCSYVWWSQTILARDNFQSWKQSKVCFVQQYDKNIGAQPGGRHLGHLAPRNFQNIALQFWQL